MRVWEQVDVDGFSNLREVVLYPTKQWGGEGLIGCGIGFVSSLALLFSLYYA